jgi:phosphoglycolate phosphatase
MNLTAVCFDLDGTLTDPMDGITRCIQHALTGMNLPSPTQTELSRYIGPPLRQTFAHLLGEENSAARVEQAVQLYRERFATIGLYENIVYPGVREMLESLSSASLRLYIATSKPRIYAEQILKHFELTDGFLRVYGSGLDGTHDNKSELLAFLLQEERIAPKEALMVGDRRQDILAAQWNSVRSVGVTYGYGSVGELQEAGADILCDTPRQVSDCILRMDS